MQPTGEGLTVHTYDALSDPGTPLPLRPARAAANDAAAWKFDSTPSANAASGHVTMKGDLGGVTSGAERCSGQEQASLLGLGQ